MSSEQWWWLKQISGFASATFTVLTTLFLFWGVKQDERHSDTQEWFRNKWQAIGESPWLSLPERLLDWTFRAKDRLTRICLKILHIFQWESARILVIGLVVMVFIISLDFFTVTRAFVITGAFVCALLLLYAISILGMFMGFAGIVRVLAWGRPTFLQWLTVIVNAICILGFSILLCAAIAAVWFYTLLDLSLSYALLLSLVLMPFSCFVACTPVFQIIDLLYDNRFNALRKEASAYKPGVPHDSEAFRRNLEALLEWRHRAEGAVFLLMLGGHAGIVWSLAAMRLGHQLDPTAYVPQTGLMLILNFFSDGITLTLTFLIFKKVSRTRLSYSLPIALLLNILLASAFACTALYFALHFSPYPLTASEVLRVLVARSPDGSRFALTPTFWVLHTTFIPLLIYMLLVLSCWLAKVFLQITRRYFGWGKGLKNALAYTSAFISVLGAILSLIVFLVAFYQEYLERKQQTTRQPTSAVLRLNYIQPTSRKSK